MPPVLPLTGSALVDLERALTGGLRTVFQPVVDLADGDVVGWEALSRGPLGGPVEGPEALFAAARAGRRLDELDWTCRCQALREARTAAVGPPYRLFVNAEPQALGSVCPEHLLPEWESAHREQHVVVEFTERYLLDAPAALLSAAERLRGLGWEIALDDVGVNDAGVALLPVLRPDVVKLDGRLLTGRLSRAQQHAVDAVRAYVAERGAHVVAEGIETEEELARAREVGADWGQGWLLGRPLALERVPAAPAARWPRRTAALPVDGSDPYELLGDEPRHAVDAAAVAAAVDEQRRAAAQDSTGSLVLVVLGRPELTPRGLPQLLDRLHDLCALVVVLTGQLDLRRPPVVRTSLLDDADVLRDDVAVVTLSPSRAVAFHARCGADGSWTSRRTTDAAAVSASARVLLGRAEPRRRERVG